MREITAMDHQEEDATVTLPATAAEPMTSIQGVSPGYLVELAKSGRAECKKCGEKIENKTIRVGVILEGDWGLFTRWQHLACTIFHPSLASCNNIDGYQDLSSDHQKDVQTRYEMSKNEVDEDMKPLDPDALVRKVWDTAVEPCNDLLMPLLPYQKEGLGWMLHQELSDIHGGILADEMGMGKTIQAVSLILQNRPKPQDKSLMQQWKLSDISHGMISENIQHCGTLIVLPTIAIRQWQMEIGRFTKEGSLKVKVYHGSDRNTSIQDLVSHDVIITSYKVLEIEYRKATAGTKVECRICGKKFYPEKLRLHRKYFCGEGAQRTEAQSKTQKKKTPKNVQQPDSNEEDANHGKQRDQKTNNFKKPEGKAKSSKPTRNQSSTCSTNSYRESIFPPSDSDDALRSSKRTSALKTKSKSSSAQSQRGLSSRSTPKRSAALQATKSIAKKFTEERDNDDTFSDDSDYEHQSGEEENSGDESISDDSTDSAKRKTNSRRVTITKSAAGAQGKRPARSRSKDNIDSSSSSDGEMEPINKRRATVENKIARSTHQIKSKKKTFGGELADDEENEPMVGSKRKASSSKAKATKGKKKFPGESSSDEEESDRKGKSGGKMRRDSTPFYDEDVERDIAAAMKAHDKELKKNATKSILHLVSWFRIILDEAHLIKDRSTSTAKAVFNLVSLNKWCLTGTPLQNRVGELYSLIRFLRFDPHAFYFCKSKGCHCKSLHYRFTNSMCDDCNHSVIHHFCHFNKHVLNPIQRSGYVADGRKAMLLLKKQILDNILLRRTKINRADDIQLPMRVVKVRQEKLDDKEEDFYQALYTQSQAQFNTYLTSGTVLNNYAHIFDILIRLRQAVDHPYLVIHGESQRGPEDETFSRNLDSKNSPHEQFDENCHLCKESLEDAVSATCGHCFCRPCILDYITTVGQNESSSKLSCPACQKPLTLQFDQIKNNHSSSVWDVNKRRRKSIIDKINLSLFQTSTKMEALMEELFRMEKRDPGAKAIVFSQFVNMLDLLEYRIQKGGIGCVKLLGSMSVEQRDKSVNAFKDDPSVKVLLISLKAGGVALNLTVANYIFLMDPWWNPAAEMQAIDRTHRIGQYKPIFATRFIIEDTIEERILKLQEKKKLVFDGTVGGDVGSMTKLTVEDMRFLFQ